MCDLLAEHEQNNKTTKKMKNRPDWPVFKKDSEIKQIQNITLDSVQHVNWLTKISKTMDYGANRSKLRRYFMLLMPQKLKTITSIGPLWWSSGQRARLLLQRS